MNAVGPLDGIAVIEIGVAMAGPFCALMDPGWCAVTSPRAAEQPREPGRRR